LWTSSFTATKIALLIRLIAINTPDSWNVRIARVGPFGHVGNRKKSRLGAVNASPGDAIFLGFGTW
jgi:hypothetical protein